VIVANGKKTVGKKAGRFLVFRVTASGGDQDRALR
jgi:hypothetical protein